LTAALVGLLAALVAAPAGAAVPRCHTADLAGHLGHVTGGAGSRFAPLVLENASAHPCSVRGYVGGTFRGHATKVVRVPGTPVTTVLLRPGRSAVADTRWSAIPRGSSTGCPTPSTLLVTPPDETTRSTVKWTGGMVCGGYELDVKALRAQAGG
jgi:Domain of unknown function (DUF4232)